MRTRGRCSSAIGALCVLFVAACSSRESEVTTAPAETVDAVSEGLRDELARRGTVDVLVTLREGTDVATIARQGVNKESKTTLVVDALKATADRTQGSV